MKRRSAIALATWLVVGATLMAVFFAYQRPELAVDLANRLWSCF